MDPSARAGGRRGGRRAVGVGVGIIVAGAKKKELRGVSSQIRSMMIADCRGKMQVSAMAQREQKEKV